jgi:outer membrane lipoprotein carrier protein
MLRQCKTGLLVALVSLSAVTIQADTLSDFTTLLTSHDRFEAAFEQVTRGQSGAVLSEVSGSLQMQRPNQFYWLSYPPQEQAVISDGTTLWVYDIDLEQVTVQNAGDSLHDSPAVILSGDAQKIASQYRIEQTVLDGTKTRFQLIPLANESTLKSLDFSFDGNRLERLWLADSLGQVTVITLSEHQYAPAFDETRFQFVAPEGVDVMDQRP